MEQRLRRHAADVRAGAAEPPPVDDGDGRAERACLVNAASPAGPAPMTTRSVSSTYGARLRRAASRALAACLVWDRGRDRHVEAVRRRRASAGRSAIRHRPSRRRSAPSASEPKTSATGPRNPLRCTRRLTDAGGEHGNTPLVQPRPDLGARRGRHRRREDRAQRGADRIGVEQVGPRVGHDHGVAGIGGPQHGAQVARLLDGLEHHKQRIGPERQRRERWSGIATTATSPSARSPYASRARTAALTGMISAPAARARATVSCAAGVRPPSSTNTVSTAAPPVSARSSSRAPSTIVRPSRRVRVAREGPRPRGHAGSSGS